MTSRVDGSSCRHRPLVGSAPSAVIAAAARNRRLDVAVSDQTYGGRPCAILLVLWRDPKAGRKEAVHGAVELAMKGNTIEARGIATEQGRHRGECFGAGRDEGEMAGSLDGPKLWCD